MTREQKIDLKRRKHVERLTVKDLREAIAEKISRIDDYHTEHAADAAELRLDAEVRRNLRRLANMAPTLVAFLRPVQQRRKAAR